MINRSTTVLPREMNPFEKLCAHASEKRWCWDLSCTTCGRQSFMRAFAAMADGIDPSSKKGLRIVHASTISIGGKLEPRPRLAFSDPEKAAVIAHCIDANLSTIADRCRFPDWLGYLGLILYYMQSESLEYQALSQEWAKQLSDMVEPNSRAYDFLLRVAMDPGEVLNWTDLELCETGMIREYY